MPPAPSGPISSYLSMRLFMVKPWHRKMESACNPGALTRADSRSVREPRDARASRPWMLGEELPQHVGRLDVSRAQLRAAQKLAPSRPPVIALDESVENDLDAPLAVGVDLS